MPALRRLALLAVAVLWLVLPSAAVGADLPELDGQVVDEVGALEGREGEVEDALDELLRDAGIQLWVAFVDSTDELTATEFSDATAEANSLGAGDVLLVVAVDDRTDAIWISDSVAGEITDGEVDSVISDVLEPRLRDGDFPGAAIATARAIGEAAAPAEPTTEPTPRTTEPPSDGGGGSEGDAGGLDLGLILGGLLVVVGVLAIAGWLMARRAAWREAEERDRETGRLAREANALLIATDERTRTAVEEAGFVEAEFGTDQAAPFQEAIGAARAELKAAFGIRQKLDDAEPEDPETRRAMLAEIVERCRRAGAALDAQAARIGELRDLERNAASILDALPAQLDAQAVRLRAADATLVELSGYAPSTWSPVRGNVTEASKGLAGARQAIDRGRALVAEAKGRDAARQIVVAQEGIAGAVTLLDAVEKLAATVRDAEARLEDEIAAARTDLDAARRGVAGRKAGDNAAHDDALDAAEEAIRVAAAAADARPRDPLSGLRLAAAARRAAADALGAVRRDAAREAQLAAALATSLRSAEADIDRTADFITTRRGGVGRRARTRLAEAERALAEARELQGHDPNAAIERAARAERLAEEAYSLAASDFDGWDRGGPSPTRGGGVDVGGVILGAILGGILSGGGGRRGGGWGGSGWGSPGGGRGGGGGWGGGGGGWGGGGHSRGGGFGGGGGGGHSRGGRW